MPCACQTPVPNYPETADWGPILWKILHGLAEKSGQGIIKGDEIREWLKFIKVTGDMLPCEICRGHYQTFLRNNSLQITNLEPTQLNIWIKSFFWNLHNQVNSSRGLPIYSYADLSTYARVDLTDLLFQLTPIIKKAITLSGVPYMTWTAWVNSFKMLRSVLAV